MQYFQIDKINYFKKYHIVYPDYNSDKVVFRF